MRKSRRVVGALLLPACSLAVSWTAGSASASALPDPSCPAAASGGSALSSEPALLATLYDQWHEAWLASPAVADLDGDGEKEIIAARHGLVLGWHLDGSIVFQVQSDAGRIWSSPVVADLDPARAGLEVAAASGEKLYVWDATGNLLPGFPVTWQNELRALAAGDIDGDSALELVVATTTRLSGGGQYDVVMAYELDGNPVAGFPPNTSGSSGCDDACYVAGTYDQNLALGDIDGDEKLDIVAPHDNASMSVHRGDGQMFDAASVFQVPTKFAGILFFFDYASAKRGWAMDEETENLSNFTNSAPAVADHDADGSDEIIVLGSAQNVSHSDRLRGVALWVLNPDGTRPAGWESPYHVSEYLAGLWDFPGTNIVGATNQVSVADLDPSRSGPDFIFAGFDGRIHAVGSSQEPVWSYAYTTDARVLTGGVVVADLSGDGRPEVVFASYSPDEGKSHLFVLGADGELQHKLPLPTRGAMPVPTLADVDGDGTLEIVVSLKDGENGIRQVQVYSVSSSSGNCLLWPTGRGNLLRNANARQVPEPASGTLQIVALLGLATFARMRR